MVDAKDVRAWQEMEYGRENEGALFTIDHLIHDHASEVVTSVFRMRQHLALAIDAAQGNDYRMRVTVEWFLDYYAMFIRKHLAPPSSVARSRSSYNADKPGDLPNLYELVDRLRGVSARLSNSSGPPLVWPYHVGVADRDYFAWMSFCMRLNDDTVNAAITPLRRQSVDNVPALPADDYSAVPHGFELDYLLLRADKSVAHTNVLTASMTYSDANEDPLVANGHRVRASTWESMRVVQQNFEAAAGLLCQYLLIGGKLTQFPEPQWPKPR